MRNKDIIKIDHNNYKIMDKNNYPVFICGFPSGGTDLLKNLLNAHERIFLNGEMPFLYNLPAKGYTYNTILGSQAELEEFRKFLKRVDVWNNLENINGNELFAPVKVPEALKYFFNNKDKPTWGNKTPQNTEHINDLIKLFPRAKFVIIIRDIRDIALSWKKKWGKDMLLCAHKWNERMSLMKQSVENNKNDFIVIKYEDILTNLESEMRKICTFLNLEWDEKIIHYEKYLNETKEGKINFGKPLIKSNKQKWKKGIKPGVIKRIEEIAYPTLVYYKYEISQADTHKKINRIEKNFGVVRDIFALFTIGNRFKSNQTSTDIFQDIKYEIKKKSKVI